MKLRLIFLCFFGATLAERFLTNFPKNIVPAKRGVNRIYGGTTAEDGVFPFMVFVLYSNISSCSYCSTCSASLVTVDKILLAAHCFGGTLTPRPENVLAIAGKTNLADYMTHRFKLPFSEAVNEQVLGVQERKALKIRISPLYNTVSQEHDVAIFAVTNPFKLTVNVQPIAISTELFTGRMACGIYGWGLAEGNTRAYNLVYSKSAHALPINECEFKKRGPFVCLQKSGSGICQGDSGSPLVCNDKVWGVASHVLARKEDVLCGEDLEEYYSTIYEEAEWLQPELAEVLINENSELPVGAGEGKASLTASQFFVLPATVLYIILF